MKGTLRFLLVCSLALCLVRADDEPAEVEKENSGLFRVEGSVMMPGALDDCMGACNSDTGFTQHRPLSPAYKAEGLVLGTDAEVTLALHRAGPRLVAFPAVKGGRFVFANVPPGVHSLEVNALGYIFPSVRTGLARYR